jgi:Protein of unknown function (DUF3467)
VTDNNPQASNQPEISPKTEWIRNSRGVYEGYANLFFSNWTPLDVRIRFAQLITDPRKPQPGGEGTSVAEEHAAITMTWAHAKILRDLLISIVSHYEKTNGEIVVPKLPPSGPAAV